jgi:Phosphatase
MLVDTGGKPEHTHSPLPIRAILAALAAAGQAPPALVVADHGWAGAAGQAGIDAIGFADSNDPALFVGEAEGRIQVCLPLDDGVAPRHYSPLTAYLLDRAGLAG